MERRRFLKGAGVAIALPVMESLMPKASGAIKNQSEDLFVYPTITEFIKKHFSQMPPKQGKTMICQKL